MSGIGLFERGLLNFLSGNTYHDDVGVKRYFDPSDTELLRALHSRNSKNIRNPLIFLQKMYCWLRSESHRCTWQMRIWEKILCLWACVAYCQNCEPNSHALHAQTVVLRSDAMRAHSRIFKQMLILSCAPTTFYVIGNKKCRSKPINSFHAGGGVCN